MESTLKLLAAPLDPSFAVILVLVGLYSLTVNARLGAKNSQPRSARLARVAGWVYIAGGIGVLLLK